MFKRDICDPRGKIGYLVAANDERSCFRWKSGNSVKFLRYLGDQFNWKDQVAFITDTDFSRFEKIRGVGTSTSAGYSNVIIINPQDDRNEIRDCGNTKCYATDKGTFETKCPDCDITWIGTTGAAWRKVDDKTGYWFNTEEIPEFCEAPVDSGGTIAKFDHDRNFSRIAWGGAHIESPYGDSIAGRCTIACDLPIIEELPPDHNGAVFIDINGVIHPQITTTSTTLKPNETETNTTSLYEHLDPKDPDMIDSNFDYPPNCTTSKKSYTPLSNQQKNEIKEQTLRMLKLHYSVVLNGQRTPEVKTPEYELFQTSRLILEKVCPDEQVPHTLLRSLLRMFRMSLNETQENKYPYLVISDAASIKRIQKSLTNCLNVEAKKQFHFQYSQCPREYMHTNITGIPVKAQIPCELQYNTTKFDYVVEAAWKTLMFVHYYCAEYFDHEQYDHSRLQFVLQKFFNRDSMHRWFQPGKSAEVFEFMFNTYDLKTFKEGIDHCVAGARSISSYKKWIKRPSYEKYCEGRERDLKKSGVRKSVIGKQNKLFLGQALCMLDYDDMVTYKFGNAACFPSLADPRCYDLKETTSTMKPITTTRNPKGPPSCPPINDQFASSTAPKDCCQYLKQGYNSSGTYKINIDNIDVDVECDMATDGGGWTIIQKRTGEGPVVDFERGWCDYEIGFGKAPGSYWIGLRNIATLTKLNDQSIQFDIKNFSDVYFYARYKDFFVAGAAEKYKLSIKGYTGTAGDSIKNDVWTHDQQYFSTFDYDNDSSDLRHCAKNHRGGFWFGICYHIHPNGLFPTAYDPNDSTRTRISWYTVDQSSGNIKYIRMKIRNKDTKACGISSK